MDTQWTLSRHSVDTTVDATIVRELTSCTPFAFSIQMRKVLIVRLTLLSLLFKNAFFLYVGGRLLDLTLCGAAFWSFAGRNSEGMRTDHLPNRRGACK